MDEEGLTDSAILLLSLGEEEAAQVFKHLSPGEVQKLGQTMARLSNVSRERVSDVLSRFQTDASENMSLSADSDEYIRSVLIKALGEDKATILLERILQDSDASGIESLKYMDAAGVADLIKNEHPQIVASILAHLERDHASGILKELPERTRNDVLLRIATLDGIQPNALRELNDVLTKLLSGGTRSKKTSIGGIKTAAEILNFIGSSEEGNIIESVRQYDPDLAQKILDEMFVFDNLLDLDDRGMQLLLREVQSESLVIALKGANEALRDKVFSNMSQRAGDMLREDLEAKGPVRVSEVEAEQKEILKTARRLADEGQLSLGGAGDDAYV